MYLNWYFVVISPFEKDMALHLNKLESPSPKDALCRLVEISPVVLEKIFKRFVIFFVFSLVSPLPKEMLFPKFGWNWLSGSLEDFF